jgi:hypothetical protein
MASGTHVASKGVWTSYGGVATLPDLSPRPRLGLTGLLWPNGAPRPLSCGLWPPC